MRQLSHYEVENKRNKTSASFIFWIDGVSNPSNIGLILRLADALAIKEIKFRGIDQLIIKKAKLISHVAHPNFIVEIVEKFLKSDKYEVIGVEITDKSIPFFNYSYSRNTIFVIGNEKSGISPEVLNICNKAVEIPMLGGISSLNAAQSLSIVAAYAAIPFIK